MSEMSNDWLHATLEDAKRFVLWYVIEQHPTCWDTTRFVDAVQMLKDADDSESRVPHPEAVQRLTVAAAAPDLLAACQARIAADEAEDTFCMTEKPCDSMEYIERLTRIADQKGAAEKMMRAAIAKAQPLTPEQSDE